MSPPLSRLLAIEIGIATVANIAFNLFFAWLMFPRDQPVGLWGPSGMAFDMLPGTFMPALMMTFGITAGLRGRMRRGLSVAGGFTPPVPRRLWLRALTIAVAAVVAMVPVTLALKTSDALSVTYANAFASEVRLVGRRRHPCQPAYPLAHARRYSRGRGTLLARCRTSPRRCGTHSLLERRTRP